MHRRSYSRGLCLFLVDKGRSGRDVPEIVGSFLDVDLVVHFEE